MLALSRSGASVKFGDYMATNLSLASWILQAWGLGNWMAPKESKPGLPRLKDSRPDATPSRCLRVFVNYLHLKMPLPRIPLRNSSLDTGLQPPRAFPPCMDTVSGAPTYTPVAAGWTSDSCSASSEGGELLPVGGHKVTTEAWTLPHTPL